MTRHITTKDLLGLDKALRALGLYTDVGADWLHLRGMCGVVADLKLGDDGGWRLREAGGIIIYQLADAAAVLDFVRSAFAVDIRLPSRDTIQVA